MKTLPPLIFGGSVISAGTIHDLRPVKVPGTAYQPTMKPLVLSIQLSNGEIYLLDSLALNITTSLEYRLAQIYGKTKILKKTFD